MCHSKEPWARAVNLEGRQLFGHAGLNMPKFRHLQSCFKEHVTVWFFFPYVVLSAWQVHCTLHQWKPLRCSVFNRDSYVNLRAPSMGHVADKLMPLQNLLKIQSHQFLPNTICTTSYRYCMLPITCEAHPHLHKVLIIFQKASDGAHELMAQTQVGLHHRPPAATAATGGSLSMLVNPCLQGWHMQGS